jgi:hypothetical protein
LCRFAKRNPQRLSVSDWFSKPEITSYNYLVDLEAQSKHPEKNHPVRLGDLQNPSSKNMLEYEFQNG